MININAKYLPFIAGVVSALVFLLAASGSASGVFLMYFPIFPLLLAGFGLGLRSVSIAALVATAISLVISGPFGALMFFLFLASPSVFMTRRLLSIAKVGDTVIWYPLSRLVVHMAGYYAVIVAVAAIYLMQKEQNISHWITEQVFAAISGAEPAINGISKEIIESYLFLIPGILGWVWVLMLLLNLWLAQFTLFSYNRNLRPVINFIPFELPNIYLLLIAALGASSVLDSGDVSFISRTLLVILLLPYFIYGVIYMHRISRAWPGRGVFLFAVYFMAAAFLWPAIMLAMLGFALHCRALARGVVR